MGRGGGVRVLYHRGGFPPGELRWVELIPLLGPPTSVRLAKSYTTRWNMTPRVWASVTWPSWSTIFWQAQSFGREAVPIVAPGHWHQGHASVAAFN